MRGALHPLMALGKLCAPQQSLGEFGLDQGLLSGSSQVPSTLLTWFFWMMFKSQEISEKSGETQISSFS